MEYLTSKSERGREGEVDQWRYMGLAFDFIEIYAAFGK